MAEAPTDGDGLPAGSSQDDLPVNDQNDQSAAGHTDTTTGGGTPDVDQTSDDEPQHGTTQDTEGSDEDEGLAKFAKAQGFDPDNLTEGEKKALKLARDNQKAYRESTQKKTEDTQKAIDEANTLEDSDTEDLTPDEAWQAEMESRQARVESTMRLNEFYAKNPEAREYDKEMGEIVLEEAQRNGKPAARYLAADLNRLYILAKARRGESETETAAEKARREERERLRKAQEAGSDGSQATNSHQSSPKVTKDWVEKEYDPSNPEHRKMVDEAIQRGELY